ncbi:MAG: alpha/beta fold hydrolase [Candidatus Acidiferrales bacterium]
MWRPLGCESRYCERSRYFRVATIVLALLSLQATVIGRSSAAVKVDNGFITTRDGVKIHYLIAGTPRSQWHVKVSSKPMGEAQVAPTVGPTLLFVPGWTMPAWIWQKQIDYFSKNYRVVAMDPRCQGDSSQTGEGLYPAARARDIKAVVDQLHLAPVVLVGWSMAVTEVAAYVDQFGTRDVAALVFVDDNFGGLTPGEANGDLDFMNQVLTDRRKTTSDFIRMLFFKRPQPEGYVQRVIGASLKVPTNTAVALLLGKFAADYRSAAAKMDKPTLFCYADSPYMTHAAQLRMQQSVRGSRLEVFEGDGHALFVDDAEHFNSVVESLLDALAK